MRSHQLRQISVCQFSSRSWSLKQDLLRYEALGFNSIGLWRQKTSAVGEEQAIDLITNSNLSVSSVHHVGGFTGDGISLDDSIEDAMSAIEFAAQVNTSSLLIHPGSINNHLFKHAAKLYQSALDKIIPVANQHNVQLVIEPVLDQLTSKFSFHNSIAHSIDLLNKNPELGLALDLYHVGMDSKAFERLAEYVDRIRLVQLADRTRSSWHAQRQPKNRRTSFRLPLGHGEIDIYAWLNKLTKLGFQGAIELEVFGQEVQGTCPFFLLDQTMSFLSMATLRRSVECRPLPKSKLTGVPRHQSKTR